MLLSGVEPDRVKRFLRHYLGIATLADVLHFIAFLNPLTPRFSGFGPALLVRCLSTTLLPLIYLLLRSL